MKELKIFAIVVFLSGILYWGIEPYAHHELHPHTDPAVYDFAAGDDSYSKSMLESSKIALEKAEVSGDGKKIENAKFDVQKAEKNLNDYKSFWNDIKAIDFKSADTVRGADVFANAGCTGCHGMKTAGFDAPMDNATSSSSFGVVAPDLSTAGAIYDESFLAAVIKNPVMAMKLNHKFGEERGFPMPEFYGVGGDDMNAELADLVAYLKSVSAKYIKENGKISDSKLFEDACQRCHDIKYDKKYMLGNRIDLANYMGSNPPDLSMMIRSKNSDNYLNKFINDPQKMLLATAMPRVGLTKESEDQVVSYLEKIGDSKKDERSSVGFYTMIYFFILGIFATLWKIKVWKELH
ncbi:c-type cytochrome [Campylobacter pinnipediorum]|uniref:c-type cytochrome n=1 Tax=Campylobacter pinnipediorum TaxID=1965231 RepID=UPI00084DB95E|nr:c-type cytochrome [Campylobacter pinnipediorum]